MPNWCLNKLTVEHDDPAMLEKFVNAYNLGKVCDTFIPEPENLDNDDVMSSNSWYNWRLNNWGTKWDIGANVGTDREEFHGLKATVVGNQANCSFDSAWSPPVGLYEKLDELGYKVHASYFEGGMAYCGVWADGYDNYIEYKTKDDIPVGIWNDFNLDDYFTDEVEA